MARERRSYWQMREDHASITPLVDTIHASFTTGVTTAEITRLFGSSQSRRLHIAERIGLIISVPTNRRHLGRRWYSRPFAPDEVLSTNHGDPTEGAR